MEPMKIYAFCNIPHTKEEEYQIANHPILAVNKHGEYVAHWVSSTHGFGKRDIEVGIYRSEKIQLPVDIEWVEDPSSHPELLRILKLGNFSK